MKTLLTSSTAFYGFLFITFLLLVIQPLAYYSMGDTVIATVTEKERIVESNGKKTSSKYLVFTDVETFENTDLLFIGKFDSSDLQGKLKVGQKYQLKVYGWRIPFFSSYRNIASAVVYE